MLFKDKVWKRALIDFTVENSFQIVFEVFNKATNFVESNSETIAFDDIKISYGSCSLLENIEYKNKKLRNLEIEYS